MGIAYSYNCVGVSNAKILAETDDWTLVQADLQFEDEHGNALVPLQQKLVVLESASEYADFLGYPENLVEDDEELFEKLADLLEKFPPPRYDTNNGKETYRMLHEALA